MKNIMKSIWYEILHSKMMIRIYILFMVIMGLFAVLNVGDSVQKGHASGMVAENPLLIYEFPIFMLSIIVGIICGEDYKDKVANYEVLSGHSRKSIFFARSLMGIIVGSVLSTILCIVPLIVGIIVDGWGDALVLSDVIIRILLLFFPMFRLAAFLALITFLVKNQYVMMASGFVIMMGCSLLQTVITDSKNIFISIFNMALLLSFDSWSIYNLDPVNGLVTYNSYVSTVTPELVIGTITASLVMTAFYLFMGYALFRRDDLS